MSNEVEAQEPKDRPFKPCKTAVSEAARAYLEEFLGEATRCEVRDRKRSASARASHRRMLECLALDLAHREISKPGAWLSVSLQKDRYTRDRRPASFITESFIGVVSGLHKPAGLVSLRKGEKGEDGKEGRQTTIRASSSLRRLIEKHGLTFHDIGRDRSLLGDPVVVRTRKMLGRATNLPLADNAETRAIRAQMQEVNAWISSADLWWTGPDGEDSADINERFLCRIFNDGRFDRGGRLFGGFWQGPDSEARLDCLRFGDEEVVELDYGQMAIRSAYAIAGKTPPQGDLYAIEGLEGRRTGVKRVLNALLGCEDLPTRFPMHTKKHFGRMKFADVLSPILRHHEPIRDLFAKRLALTLMYRESELLLAVLLRLKARGVVALPIHDCVLVRESAEETARQVMEESFEEFLGMKGVVEVSRPPPLPLAA